MHRLSSVLFTALSLLLVACGEPDGNSFKTSKNPCPLNEAQPLQIDGIALMAEVAIAQSEQALGLMHREKLAPDHGMIFVYRTPQKMAFWMKNTLIPLDIGFFSADGELLQIARMYPRDRNTTPSHSDQVKWALEMEQGWFHSKGLKPGARLDLDSLRRALAARGTNPKQFGL